MVAVVAMLAIQIILSVKVVMAVLTVTKSSFNNTNGVMPSRRERERT